MIFKLFLPELHCLDNYSGNKHNLEGDVYIHTKMCVEEINTILTREIIEGERKLLLLIGNTVSGYFKSTYL